MSIATRCARAPSAPASRASVAERLKNRHLPPRHRAKIAVGARASSDDGAERDANDDVKSQGARESSPKLVPYNVRVATPPPVDLGLHKLPKNIACGETIEVPTNADGDESANGWFIVNRVTTMYNLVRGRYRKDGSRLDVQKAERYFINASLERLYSKDD